MMMSARLQQLLNIYLTGKLTEDQRLELSSLLENEEEAAAFAGMVQQQLSDREFTIPEHLPVTENRVLQGIIKRIDRERAVVMPIRRAHFFRRWGWAVAVIILFAAGAYLWLLNGKNHQSLANGSRQLQNDVAPGGDKAILTLSDGATITLDSAANGAIAQQGNSSIVKLANGQISYRLKGEATGEAMMNTMRTPRGGQYRLTLPDGTQVWLNAASSITYPTAFVAKERKVAISGEAYFEVAENKEKPFIVDVDGKSAVEVLGTHFNVNSYADENAVRTTLLEGRVKVSNPEAAAVVLSPGQQAIVLSDRQPAAPQRISVINKADLDKVMAWKNGLFNFEDANLQEVMRQLERWYDLEVVYEKGVPDIEFGGKISRNIKLSDLLKVLARAEVKFRLEEGHRLVVLP